MSKQVKAWARRARAALLEKLGGKCVDCGSYEQLTFDCIIPCGHAHHKGSTDQRIMFYRREHERGNIAIRCNSCNAAKGESLPDGFFDFNQHQQHPF